MDNKNYQRVGTAIVNRNTAELDKYLEQRRAIKSRAAQRSENEQIIDMLKTLMDDVAEIKRRLDS